MEEIKMELIHELEKLKFFLRNNDVDCDKRDGECLDEKKKITF